MLFGILFVASDSGEFLIVDFTSHSKNNIGRISSLVDNHELDWTAKFMQKLNWMSFMRVLWDLIKGGLIT